MRVPKILEMNGEEDAGVGERLERGGRQIGSKKTFEPI